MAKIDELFKIMAEKKASDLHLSASSPPCLRLHGEMTIMDEMPVLSNEDVQNLIFEILSEKQKRQFMENWELDCSYAVENLARFRVNVFMQRKGMGGVFRIIPDKIKSFEELGLPQEFLTLIDAHRGLICVTGPTGSGKSTTLAALIHHINTTRKAHIITIEDPIEFVHANRMSLVNQREVTSHTKSFANALKATLREDPDIILLGEMRDLETIGLALTAAETGHLVFGTLHTSSAHKTVDRIIDVFPEARQAQIRVQLSESLRGVISQTLLAKNGGGRVPAFECLFNNKAIGNLIREGKTFQIPSTMQISKGSGCITFEQSIQSLLQKQLLTKEQAAEALGHPVTPEKKEPEQSADHASGGSGGGGSAGGTSAGFSNPFKPQQPPVSGVASAASATQEKAAAAAAAIGNFADRFRKAK